MPKNQRVTVFRGGKDGNYAISMRTGSDTIKTLNRLGYQTRDIVVTKNQEFLEEGRSRNISLLLEGADIVFLGLHGKSAEDGSLQKILQKKSIKFNGSSSLSSAMAFNKLFTKNTLKSYGVLTPQHFVLPEIIDVNELEKIVTLIKDSFGPNYIIKPIANSSSLDSYFAANIYELKAILFGLFNNKSNQDRWLIEEFIDGKEISVALLENFRNEKTYVFPPGEIIFSSDYPYFTYEAKLKKQRDLYCPSTLTYSIKNEISQLAEKIHTVLNLSQYSRSDFIVSDDGKIYFLEINSLPELSCDSTYTKIVESVGVRYEDLINHIITTSTA